MYYLKAYLSIGLVLYACLSLQVTLWFYLFPFAPSPQIWISFIVYAALYTNKTTVTIVSLFASLLLSSYTLFKGFPLFFSLCSCGYIIFYIKETLFTSSIKTFFVFSLLSFIAIQMLYSTYTGKSFSASIQKSFTVFNIYSSLLTAVVSLLFFYFFRKKKIFSKISNPSTPSSKHIGWV